MALTVQDIVVFQDVFSNLGVSRLHLRLRGLNRAGDHTRFDSEVFFTVCGAGHQRLGSSGVEQPHEVVLQGQVEAALPRVTLTTGASSELIVDAARLVAFGAKNIEATSGADFPALLFANVLDFTKHGIPGRFVLLRSVSWAETLFGHFLHSEELSVSAQHDVGSATGHIGGDGHGTEATCLGDDGGFAGVVFRVQHFVFHACFGEHGRNALRLFHACRSD
ncbi:MAG: Uncharacterised protein [Cellulomonadaceae bacterium TMED98]|nr:MAG: Uncharacterised protein [Cellulomonadaceae bacterium TMED98]